MFEMDRVRRRGEVPVIPGIKIPTLSAERKVAVISAALLFCTIAAFIVLKSARDAYFLSRFKVRALPWFMGLTTVITIVTASLYLRLYKIISIERAVRISLITFAIGTFCFWTIIPQHEPLYTGIFYAWVSLFGTLASVQVWLLISRQFLSRQARRHIGTIGAGGLFGAIAGGLIARVTTEFSHVSTLIPMASGLIFFSFLAALVLPAPIAMEEKIVEKSQPQQVSRRLVILMVIVVGVATICSSFIEFQFKAGAQHHLRTARNLAVFFGSFYAYAGAASLTIQLVATPFLLRTFGILSTLTFLPSLLIVSNSLVLLTSSFWSVIGLRGTEETLKHSIDRSSLEVLYFAMPEEEKIRLKSVIDTVGVRAAEGMGAILLIVLFSVARLPPQVLAVITLVLLSIWLLATVLLGHEYPNLLRSSFERKVLDPDRIKDTLFTTDFYRFLPHLLKDGEKQQILDLLEIMESSNKRWLARYLLIPLEHQDPDIRLKALRILFHQGSKLTKQIRKFLTDSDRRIRAEAGHYLCLHSDLKKRPIDRILHDSDPLLEAALCACVLKTRPTEKIVFEKFDQLIKNSLSNQDSEVRAEIAHILEFTKPSEHTARICKILLNDPVLEVMKSSLQTISQTGQPEILPELIRLTRNTSVLREVRLALASYGESLVPQLRKIVDDPNSSTQQKKLAIKVAGDIGGTNALDFLIEAAGGKNIMERLTALKALSRLRKSKAIELNNPVFNELLENELAYLENEFFLYQHFTPQQERLLGALLRERRRWVIESIFQMLSLLYDPDSIYNAYLAWISGDYRQTDTALEFLDTIVTPELRTRILPLLELKLQDATIVEDMLQVQTAGLLSTAQMVPGLEGASVQPAAEILEPEFTRKQAFFTFLKEKDPVLAALAIADLTPEEFKEWQTEIQTELESFPADKLLQETLNWRSMMEQAKAVVETENSQLNTIEKMEQLTKIDIFSTLGTHELLLLADVSDTKKFKEGEEIFREGEMSRALYCVLEGAVELSRSGVVLRTLHKTESFGAYGVLGNKPHIITARAVSDCVCFSVDRESFCEILEEYPGIVRGIFGVLVDQIEILLDRMTLEERSNQHSDH